MVLALASATTLAYVGGCGGKSKEDLRQAGFDRNPVGVPAEAKMVQYQQGKAGGVLDPNTWFSADNATFKPASAGEAWVVDEQNAKVVFHTKLKAGDELVIVPKENAIRLNGAFVYSRRLPDEHGFLIYYLPQ
jgi:hypothetical protein